MLFALFSQAWGAVELAGMEEGEATVGRDGWVLLCYGADWDKTYDEAWMRRQHALFSAAGNAQVIYVPVWQDPSEEQRQQSEARLRGAHLGEHPFRSLPCAIMLDPYGYPYKVISGSLFLNDGVGQIRGALRYLRERNDLLEQAAYEEGATRANTLGRIWRMPVDAPPGLRRAMAQADPEDKAGIAAISPFDAWAFAAHVHRLPWAQVCAEFERMEKMPLLNDERQALLSIRMGCERFFLMAAGASRIKELAQRIAALGADTPRARAAARAAELWGEKLSLRSGWEPDELPRVLAPCEFSGAHCFRRPGTYRLTFTPGKGADAVCIRGVVLTDGARQVSADGHGCLMEPGEVPMGNEYLLTVDKPLARPCLEVIFDQRGRINTSGRITVEYRSKPEEEFRPLKLSEPRSEVPSLPGFGGGLDVAPLP